MSRLFFIFAAALLAATVTVVQARQTPAQAEKLLASAQHKATIDGDLKGAIDDYRKAIAAAGSNRAIVAQALLRMAECHQKLGDAQAQAIYEQLLRDYPDQKDVAVVARTRLVRPSIGSSVKGDRTLWSGEDADGFGTISPDARYLTYTDWANDAQLAIRDLSTGASHRLTDGGGSTQFSAISRDGRHVAYQWWIPDTPPGGDRLDHLRVARLHGITISEPRSLLNNPDITGAAPYDWSPDNKWIAVGLLRRDRTNQIALVDAQTGSLRILKSLDWKEPTKIFFSPDGRYIAYDLMTSDARDERHVFVMAADGSRETAIVSDPSQNIVMGWSPGGTHLLFASNRSGSFGLWSVGFAEGRANGAATLIKPDIAASWSLGLTGTGTMYVWKYASPVLIQASAIDLDAGKLITSPSNFQHFIGSRGRPEWSPAGDRLAYQTCNPLGGGPCKLWIRSMAGGRTREVPLNLGYFFFPRWSPNGRELIVRGVDRRGRNNGLYRIDVEDGAATLVVSPFPAQSMPQWAADGTHVYYRRGAAVLSRDLASGDEREVVRIPTDRPSEISMAPDGRHLVYQASHAAGSQGLFLIPIGGGQPRLLFEVKAPERLMMRFDWTANGSAIAVATRRDDNAEQALWMVPIDERKPRRLDIDVNNWSIMDGFRFDRAGKQVAFVATAGAPGLEIRALENFLPAAATKPTAKK